MSKRSRLTWSAIAIAVAAYAAYNGIRINHLYGNSGQLFAESSRLPRTYSLGDPRLPAISYVALGDSTTAGTGAGTLENTYVYDVAQTIARHGHYVKVTNLGVSGARVKDVVDTQVPRLASLKPDFVTVSVGANDATHFTPLRDYERSMKQLLNALKDAHAIVLVASSPNLANAPALPYPINVIAGARAKRQNILLRSAIGGPMFSYIDLYYRGKLDYNEDHALYANDLFHPSYEGYEVWAGLFEEKL
jgi:acyl-CoA thioesterase-1